MTRLGRLSLLAALAFGSASAVTAQRSGTFELGAFAHYTKLDKDVLLGSSSLGGGLRLGFFPLRHLELEAEYGIGTVKSDNIRDVSAWIPFRGLVLLNLPIAPKVKLLLGGGYKYDVWKGDITKNQYEDAFTYLAGLRFCMNNSWSIRPDVVLDLNPSPNFQVPVTSTSKHFGVRLGISKFVGRGHSTCAHISESAPPPPPPATTRPVPAAPPAAPPPTPRPTVSLSASPTSIQSGSSSMLIWSSTNAMSCSGPWTTTTTSSGSQSVSPTSTTTYTISCTGPGGNASTSATVNVSAPPAAAPPPPVRPPVAEAPPRDVYKLEGVFFDFDKSTIKPEGRIKLDSAVKILNNIPALRVEIQGHTDSIASNEYNDRLSERRAKAVFDYLTSKGIPASRLTMRGFGETQPIADNGTAAGRALNRRVMLIEIRQ